MANLPHSGQPASMDALTVSREEFRQGMNKLLEFLAQALGGVPGTFTTEDIDPLALLLAGEPKLLAAAVPPAADDSTRLPSTSWVKAVADGLKTYIDARANIKANVTQLPAPGGGKFGHFTWQFAVPGLADVMQVSAFAAGYTDANGQLNGVFPHPFKEAPAIWVSHASGIWYNTGTLVAAWPKQATATSFGAEMRSASAGGPAPYSGQPFYVLAIGQAAGPLP